MNIKEKFLTFMRGRYGNDTLNIMLLVLYIVLAVINMFAKTYIIAFIQVAVAILVIYRIFSRNICKRQNENMKFLKIWDKVKKYFKRLYFQIKGFKNFCYRTCPNCNARLRLTKKRGKHTVMCPLCKKEFQVKIIF